MIIQLSTKYCGRIEVPDILFLSISPDINICTMVRTSNNIVTDADVRTLPTTRSNNDKTNTLDVNPPSKKRCSVQFGI